MSLESFTSRVLTEYKADTSDAKRAIKELRGVEKTAAKERLAELEIQNGNLDKSIAMWGKVAAGIGLAYGAMKVGQEAFKAYTEDLRLESAAAGVDIDKLRSATMGLVETDKLLEFAGKSMNGNFKLTQGEMELVLKEAMALRKTMGVELIPTIDAFTEAMAKGATRGLKEFGIEAKDKKELIKEMQGDVAKLGGNFGMAGDDITAAGVSIADSMDDVMGSLGEMVVAMQPAIDAFAKLVSWIAKSITGLDEVTDKILGISGAKNRKQANAFARAEAQQNIANLYEGMGFKPGETTPEVEAFKQVQEWRSIIRNTYDREAMDARADNKKNAKAFAEKYVARMNADVTEAMKEHVAKKRGASPKVSGELAKEAVETAQGMYGMGRAIGNAAGGLFDQASMLAQGYRRLDPKAIEMEAQAMQQTVASYSEMAQAALGEIITAINAVEDAKNQTFQNIFGFERNPFDEMAQSAQHLSYEMEQLQEVFEKSMGTIVQGAGDAWVSMIVDGENFGKSMQKVVASVLMGLSKEFFVRSLGAAAGGNFVTAGLYLGASTAAAVAAKSLGAGSDSSARPSASGSYGGARNFAPVGGGSGKGENITIILDDGYYDETKRERRKRLSNAVREGMRDTGSNTVRHM